MLISLSSLLFDDFVTKSIEIKTETKQERKQNEDKRNGIRSNVANETGEKKN